MKYILLAILIAVVYVFAYCLCQMAGEDQYPDILDDTFSEDEFDEDMEKAMREMGNPL